MGLVQKLLALVSTPGQSGGQAASQEGETETTHPLEFHHVRITDGTGGLEVLTYVTGARMDEPTVVASTATVRLPAESVLVRQDPWVSYTEVGAVRCPVYTYSLEDSVAERDDVETYPLPAVLQGKRVEKQDLASSDLEALASSQPSS